MKTHEPIAVKEKNAFALQEDQKNDSAIQCKGYAARTTYSQPPVQRKSNSTGLPDNIKGGIENLSGMSMDDVKVHYNSSKPAKLQALAYTQGADIHVATGQEKHLPHEAWHVVQQKQGRVKPTIQTKSAAINDDEGLEKEADLMGEKARTSPRNNIQTADGNKVNSSSLTYQRVVQRRIGFEIETGIPAKKKKKDKYVDPSYEDFNIALKDGSKLDVDANPSGGGKILEFASVAVDDTQKSEDFSEKATKWLELLTTLRDEAMKTPPIKRLKDVVKLGPRSAYIGVEEGKKPDKMERVSIQATHGLRLDQVRSFLNNLKLNDPVQSARAQGKQQALQEAAPTIAPVIRQVLRIHPRKKLDKTLGVTSVHIEELKGFYSLLAHYMLAGKYVASGYFKNRAALFYKSKLSDVRNKLVAENPYAAIVLTSEKAIQAAMIALLVTTKRKKDEGLYTGSNKVNIWDWMENIFRGVDDLAFEASKNPWGTDIKPDKVTGGLAAVVEHRDIDKVVPSDTKLVLSKPAEIVNYLTKIFEANKTWEGMEKK